MNLSTDIQDKICELYLQGMGSTSIMKELNLINPQQVFYVISKRGIKSRGCGHPKYKFDQKFFERINTEKKAYWLGFIIADGSVDERRNTLQIGLAARDKEHLEKFKLHLKSSHPIHERYRLSSKGSFASSDGCHYAHISLISSNFISDLVKLGIKSNKTFTCDVPNIPHKLSRHMWRGIFDGDGYCYVGKSKNTKPGSLILEAGISGNEFITESFLRFLESNNIKGVKFKESSIFSVRCTGKNALKLLDFFYHKSVISLDRKFKKYIEYKTWREAKDAIKPTHPGIRKTSNNKFTVRSIGSKNIYHIGTFQSLNEALVAQKEFKPPLKVL